MLRRMHSSVNSLITSARSGSLQGGAHFSPSFSAMTPGAAGGAGLGLVLVEVHVSDPRRDDPVHMIGHYLDSPPGRIRSAKVPTGRGVEYAGGPAAPAWRDRGAPAGGGRTAPAPSRAGTGAGSRCGDHPGRAG